MEQEKLLDNKILWVILLSSLGLACAGEGIMTSEALETQDSRSTSAPISPEPVEIETAPTPNPIEEFMSNLGEPCSNPYVDASYLNIITTIADRENTGVPSYDLTAEFAKCALGREDAQLPDNVYWDGYLDPEGSYATYTPFGYGEEDVNSDPLGIIFDHVGVWEETENNEITATFAKETYGTYMEATENAGVFETELQSYLRPFTLEDPEDAKLFAIYLTTLANLGTENSDALQSYIENLLPDQTEVLINSETFSDAQLQELLGLATVVLNEELITAENGLIDFHTLCYLTEEDMRALGPSNLITNDLCNPENRCEFVREAAEWRNYLNYRPGFEVAETLYCKEVPDSITPTINFTTINE
ncbi:hypothetical protein GF362_02165 [Candidatus Dojkabacteria bacterium]|nr:hypothetical protein [Candidatus Dojkabacteria bacterium]